LAWPPWEYVGSGRFDDPAGHFRVLYTTAQRKAAFIESLAPFRPSIEVLAALEGVTNSGDPLPTPHVPAEWYQQRGIGRLRLGPHQRWLDLRSVETRETLRTELAKRLLDSGLQDLDLSGVVGPSRKVTQTIARAAHEHGYAGLVYHSRLDAALTCWAIFEGATFEPTGTWQPILPVDPDLLATAQLFSLILLT
jgi:RES domain